MAMHISQLMSSEAVAIRQLWPVEQALFRQHLDELDPKSRALRFGGMVHDSFLDVYARSAFTGGHMVYGAFVDARLVGVGEIKLIASKLPLRAETAFSVVPEWQDKGVGDALIGRIIAALQNRSVTSVSLWCLASNKRMRHLAEKHGSHLEFSDADETRSELDLPWPMPSSIMEEVCGEAACYAQNLYRGFQFAARTSPATSLPS